VCEKVGRPLRFAGKVGAGFDARARKALRARLDELATDTCPLDPVPAKRPELRGARWVSPSMVIRVELGGWSRDGLVRQSAFKGIDEGRDPDSVIREEAVAALAAAAEAEAATPAEANPVEPKPDARARAGRDPTSGRRASVRAAAGWAAATETELNGARGLGKQGAWRVGGVEL
jgi:bifunctional non-homologous end joining protein LigD